MPEDIKIDVDAHEKSVLLGAKSLLATAHPTIMFSFSNIFE